ncbi:MAG: hypothetical protein KIT26_04940, partial [Nitrosomonas sp.]|nr:hypothetical protein [Nitrosomonas sp.]
LGAQIVQNLDDQGVSVRRNPPHVKGMPHIRRITPRPNKSDKSIFSQIARLIRTRGEILYAARGAQNGVSQKNRLYQRD